MLEKFYQDKYGKEISFRLFENNQIIAENIRYKNKEDQFIVKEHIEKINQILNLQLNINDTNWAFDFSGWLGKLETERNSLKKYMILGLEPHIERYDFQITYGLSDKTPEGKKRFNLKTENKFEINCEDDSSLIWTNLFKIMASEKQINKVLVKKNEQIMHEFLNQFYITDLCHFAPQDKAKAIFDVKGWKKIRFKVAQHFLKKEIELIKPETIITQGNGVFSELKRILKFNETKSYPIKFGKNNWSVKTGQDKEGKYTVLSIPHFGTEMNYKTFYMKNRDLVRNILIEIKKAHNNV